MQPTMARDTRFPSRQFPTPDVLPIVIGTTSGSATRPSHHATKWIAIRFHPTTLALLFAALPVLAGSSNSLMDVSPDGSRLIVANPDNGSVAVIDPASRQKLHEIAVGGKLEGVTWIGNGPLAVV